MTVLYLIYMYGLKGSDNMSPRTGRPIKGTAKRTKRLEVRLTPDELTKIQKVAEKHNLSKADVIVKAINLLDSQTE